MSLSRLGRAVQTRNAYLARIAIEVPDGIYVYQSLGKLELGGMSLRTIPALNCLTGLADTPFSRSGPPIFGLLMVLQREYNPVDNARRRGPETWVLEAVSPMGIAS